MAIASPPQADRENKHLLHFDHRLLQTPGRSLHILRKILRHRGSEFYTVSAGSAVPPQPADATRPPVNPFPKTWCSRCKDDETFSAGTFLQNPYRLSDHEYARTHFAVSSLDRGGLTKRSLVKWESGGNA